MRSKAEARAADPAPSLRAAFLAALSDRPKKSPSGADAFITAIAADYRPEELPGVALADIAFCAADLWAFAEATASDATAIRVHPAASADGADLGADLVEIVQPDAPFLVDSVMAELIDAGASLMAMFHPLVERGDGLRSLIQVWIEPMATEDAPHLEAGLRATLADVRLAVGDFESMVSLFDRCAAQLRTTAPHPHSAALAEDLAFLDWLRDGRFVFLGARAY